MSGDILRQLGRRVSMMLGIGRITAHASGSAWRNTTDGGIWIFFWSAGGH